MTRSESSVLLARARDLYQQGLPEQAEDVVGRLLRDNPRDATALGFRAYLLYRRGNLGDAVAAYRTLAELEPAVPGHRANLGLVCFKAQRYAEAQQAFERLLELQPGDAKGWRNLGFCHERRESPEKALDCFIRAGDEQQAARIRERLARPPEGGTSGAARPASGAAAFDDWPAGSHAARHTGLAAWLAGACLPRAGEHPSFSRAGSGDLVVTIRERVLVNPAFCVGQRGAVVFAAPPRDVGKSAAKFGGRFGAVGHAEGAGEIVLSGFGAALHVLHLGGERLFVNWGALALCGGGVAVSFDQEGTIKETFLATELAGSGPVVLAVRGTPVALPVEAEMPALARPGSVVAWTEAVGYEAEIVPGLKGLAGKTEALRYRFEGRGHLVLQS